MAGAPAQDGTQKVKKSRWFLMGMGALTVLALIFLAVFSHRGLYRIYRLRLERQAVEQENIRLMADNERLSRTIDRLRHDPEMIQDLIRRELNFVKKNEIIFQFPASGTKAKSVSRSFQARSFGGPTQTGGKLDPLRRIPGPPQRSP